MSFMMSLQDCRTALRFLANPHQGMMSCRGTGFGVWFQGDGRALQVRHIRIWGWGSFFFFFWGGEGWE